MPTLLRGRRRPGIKDKLLQRLHQAGGKTFKVHLDGYNQLFRISPASRPTTGARNEFIYFNDDGDARLHALRELEVVFAEQRTQGTMRIWAEPFTNAARSEDIQPACRIRTSAPTSRRTRYYDWMIESAGAIIAGPRMIDGLAVPGDLQGVSAEPAPGELHRRLWRVRRGIRTDSRSSDDRGLTGSAQ